MHIIGRKNPLSAYMLKANRMPQVNSSSASVNQNTFGSRSGLTFLEKQGPTHIGPDLDPNCLMLKVFLVFFFVIVLKKGHFEEN